ncbi:MAG: hypothetical protein KIT87_08715 [Anaerolineae bacterium]|nr:hypothetical protein [Anaerolineae bacterium]
MLFFCPICGDDFYEHRCPRCGRLADSLSGPVIWEACQIECAKTRKPSFLGSLLDNRAICRFSARAHSWLKGGYRAGESREFRGSYPYPCRDNGPEPTSALQELIDELRNEGWEIYSHVEDWYGHRLRRREKDVWEPKLARGASQAPVTSKDTTRVTLREFITKGRLGLVAHRMSQWDLEKVLGVPDKQTTHFGRKWRYSDLEFLLKAGKEWTSEIATITIHSPFNLPLSLQVEGEWLTPDTTVDQFKDYMQKQGLGYVPVVDSSEGDYGLAHIIGQRDFCFGMEFRDGKAYIMYYYDFS